MSSDVKEEYKKYLDRCFHKLEQEARTYDIKIDYGLSPDKVYRQVPIWEVENFVWPTISLMPSGALKMHWEVEGHKLVVDLTGYDPKLSLVSITDGRFVMINTTYRYAVDFSGELLTSYQRINNTMNNSKINWKRQLLRDTY